MECTSKKQQSKTIDLVKSLNDLGAFGGKWRPEDVVSSMNEIKEKEKNFRKVQNDRKLELKRQEKLRKEQEIQYREFCMNEARIQKGIKKNGRPLYTPPPMSFGRGALLSASSNGEVGGEKVRGRGRLSPEEKECLPQFSRSTEVKTNIDQFTDSKLYNNKVQQAYWRSLNQQEEEEEEDCDYVQESINYRTPTSSTPDQFEDAFDSPQSDSPQSFCSFPSRASNSPATLSSPWLEPIASNDPPLQPRPRTETSSSTTPRKSKPRVSRLAAKFSRNFEEDDVNVETPYIINNEEKPNIIINEEKPPTSDRIDDDPFAILGCSQPPLAPSGFRKGPRSNGGMLFKHINSSHRVLPNTVLGHKELFYCGSAITKSNTEFNLREEDFPAL